MESEQSQNFNERLTQWVASQGLLFQIRHSMSGTGNAGNMFSHLLSMGLRVLILLLIVGVASLVYLDKKSNSPATLIKMENAFQEAIRADSVTIKGYSRSGGGMKINTLKSEGGSGTFFRELDARNVRSSISLKDRLAGNWRSGPVTITTLDMDLNGGADDAASASSMAEAMFGPNADGGVTMITAKSANISWGFAERMGSIRGSTLVVQRFPGGMKLTFSGGTFSQNWLRDLEIVQLVAQCDRDGITFKDARFSRLGGSVDLTGLVLQGGERPSIKGEAIIRSLRLDGILPTALQGFVTGAISGDFDVTGSTNTTDGIAFSGKVILENQDQISVMERVHLLKALTVADYARNYPRIDFKEGSFMLKTGGGGARITDVKLNTKELVTFDGEMVARFPTPEETKATLGSGSRSGSSKYEDAEVDSLEKKKGNQSEFNLRSAALAAKKNKDALSGGLTGATFDELAESGEMNRMEMEASERVAKTLWFDGKFNLGIPADSFERAPRLLESYPVSQKTKMIQMDIPISGGLYELTLLQAEEIYQQVRQ